MDDDLIILEDGIPMFNPVAKTIPELNKIVVRARKKAGGSYQGQKDLATLELAYVWFMEHFKSPYQERYPDDEAKRDEAVRRRLKLEDWKALEDEDILAAREAYRGDPSYCLEERLLKNARILANKVADQFEALAITADANSKNVAQRPKSVMKDLKEIGEIIDDLKEVEKRARKAEKKQVLYGNKEKNPFEDPHRTKRR